MELSSDSNEKSLAKFLAKSIYSAVSGKGKELIPAINVRTIIAKHGNKAHKLLLIAFRNFDLNINGIINYRFTCRLKGDNGMIGINSVTKWSFVI